MDIFAHSIGLANRFTCVSGPGKGSTHLNAFDAALIASGVGNYNLLRVSSILPPQAVRSDVINVPFGAPLLIAYGFHEAHEKNDLVSASISIGVPKDRSLPGVIMEHSHHGSLDESLRIVRGMAEEGMGMRKFAIDEIIAFGSEIRSDGGNVCAFAGCALWR